MTSPSPSPQPGAGGTPPVLAGAGAGDADHRAAILRMRRILFAGTALWVSAIGIDAVMAYGVRRAAEAFPVMLALRVAQTALLATAMTILRRSPGPHAVDRVWRAVFLGANVCQAGFTLALGTIHGPYAHGASVTLLAAGLAVPDQWRRGLRLLGPSTLVYPATILAAGIVSPSVRAQLATPDELLAFGVDVAVLMMTTLLLLSVGHAFWALRRELFEARRLGGYRLRKRIAVGGMGEVWQAWHGALKREIAVKILRLDNADPAAAARFEREAASTAALTHPNTVRVLDYGVTEDGLSYYAMELLAGHTVAELVSRDGAMPAARVVHLALQATAALAEAHAAGMVHRDIKPSNLLVTTTGGEADFVKLIDFGIARVPKGTDATLTQVHMVVGTPAYMAPEQAAGIASPASDIYALGAVCYFALTGGPVFAGDTPEVVLARHQNEQAPRASVRASSPVPADLEAIVARCLRKDPEQRYAGAAELHAALLELGVARAWRPARPGAAIAGPPPPVASGAALEPTRPLPRAGE